MYYIVVENENGLMVAHVSDHETGEEVAVRQAAIVVDSGPYRTFDDAYDAMQLIPATENDPESDS